MSKYEDRIKAANVRWLKKDSETLQEMEKKKNNRNRELAKEFYEMKNHEARKETR